MKSFAIVCAALLVAGMVATASAGEHVNISKSTLASMGFGSAKVMSDADGSAVRGKGYSHHSSVTTSASVSGTSSASFHGTTSSNQYAASSSHSNSGGASASGSSLSFAGNVSGGATGNGFHVSGSIAISGGGAFASAH